MTDATKKVGKKKPGDEDRIVLEQKGRYGDIRTAQALLDCVDACHGGLGNMAETVGIHRQTVAKYRDEYEEIEQAIYDAKHNVGDKIKSAFFDNALNGNVAAQIFYLKTQEGWKETNRLEVDADVRTEHKNPEDFAEQMRLWKEAESEKKKPAESV